KLLNQGMIQGSSRFVYRFTLTRKNNPSVTLYPFQIFPSKNTYDSYVGKNISFDEAKEIFERINTDSDYQFDAFKDDSSLEIKILPIHVDVSIVDGTELDIEAFQNSKPEYKD